MNQNHGIFQVQTPTKENEDAIIRNNMLIDVAFGHGEFVKEFSRRHPRFAPCLEYLRGLSRQAIAGHVNTVRKNSLFMTVMMLTGECNANCDVCYTDRKDRKGGLSASEMRSVLDQAYALGSRVVYIPGEGEPTLDSAFWDILEHVARLRMKAIVFTNGILLSNDSQSLLRWGITSDDFVRRLATLPVYVYHKLWSLQPKKHASMMGIPVSSYDWARISVERGGCMVPRGLVRMLDFLPKDRIGVQVVAERRNFSEIGEYIIPFIQELHLRSYIEPVLHSGRMRQRRDFDLSEDELWSLSGWLSRTVCRRAFYKVVIHNDGTLSPGMGFTPDELDCCSTRDKYSIRDQDGNVKDVFSLIHNDTFFAWARYQVDGCLCEKVNRWLGGLEPRPPSVSMETCHSCDSTCEILGTPAAGL